MLQIVVFFHRSLCVSVTCICVPAVMLGPGLCQPPLVGELQPSGHQLLVAAFSTAPPPAPVAAAPAAAAVAAAAARKRPLSLSARGGLSSGEQSSDCTTTSEVRADGRGGGLGTRGSRADAWGTCWRC